jgi:hypothetical protein
MSQAPANSGIDIYYQNGYLTFSNGTALITEPPVGRWTHVALVCNSGSVTVYYNGRPQSNYSATANLGDSSNPLYIGRRGNNDFQYFPGELTGIRINNTVLYSTAFTPSRLPTAPTGTKLVMNGYYPLVDQSTSGHSISNGGATKTTDFPKLPATSSGGGGVGGGGFNGHPGVTVQLTPNINGVGAPEQAYAGDTITWTITSDSSMSGTTIYWWVDNDTAPMSTWESGANSGSVVLDSNGSATFDKKVAQNINAQFRMYIGVALYFGTVTHGYIGI